MCDWSLESVASRPAAVGDELTVHQFGVGTTGFVAASDPSTAVCMLPGTEVAFADNIRMKGYFISPMLAMEKAPQVLVGKVAVFCQVNPGLVHIHHDALELPDGARVMVNDLELGQTATVLQLPAKPLVSHVDLPADCEASEPATARQLVA